MSINKKQQKNIIKIIAFDLGGVYFHLGYKKALEKIYRTFDVTRKKVHQALKPDMSQNKWLFDIRKQQDVCAKGKIRPGQFWQKIGEELGVNKKETKRVKDMWNASDNINEGTRELVKDIRKDHKTIIFSDNTVDRVRYLNNKYKFLSDFDNAVFSYNVGYRKNQVKMYKILVDEIKRMGYKPEECIYIDDSEKCIGMAKKYTNINTIVFKNAEQTREELEKYGCI